ncbi:restriction endonuclease [Haloarcula laminariae]|uniref:restriction endonuclease n=1 Tax=Haloarcula laminariae TaxID=2961577 RepID=UPI00240521C0|nr:restriction endonuclease [Halomicroarcula sp. FL173]
MARARAARDGEDHRPDRIESDDEPAYEVSATLGDVEAPTAIAEAIEPRAERSPDSAAERLARLDGAELTGVVGEALTAQGWETRAASPRTPFDLLATRSDERMGVIVSDSGVTTELVAESAEVTGAAGTDGVALATNKTVPEAVSRRAREHSITLLDGESLVAAVDDRDLPLPAPVSEPR